MRINCGKVILFGSGETSETGKAIYRHVLSKLPGKQNVVILETPAGFQPNSRKVAQDVAQIFATSLSEFVNKVSIIPARYKKGYYSTNNSSILAPIKSSSFIFMGPGSPTYAVRMLRDSKAWDMIIDRWQQGATLCFSSAVTLAISEFTLPVYEIYKVGTDLFWEKGLNLLKLIGLPITYITHWNNQEGGKDLDTRFCYMGEERFKKLKKLLPPDISFVGIDEHTAIVFDIQKRVFNVDGVGKVTILRRNKEECFTPGKFYKFNFQ